MRSAGIYGTRDVPARHTAPSSKREMVPRDKWEADGIVDREVFRTAGEAGSWAWRHTRGVRGSRGQDFGYNSLS
ncbi:MAG: hypothetical protein R2716_11275 [Microthrixaceae bacterium]